MTEPMNNDLDLVLFAFCGNLIFVLSKDICRENIFDLNSTKIEVLFWVILKKTVVYSQ